ncbi:hypothetical protein AVEN_119333-1 [Araneus ventricosus]|uniref:Uncharacterized protein n=1 Tax=Araneus ventricosus TaxID=182803 RepID=A0A4Y2TJD8_ARAVE|nr:hypothetical protein AVEN_119333-1 [Araneus ventricosus]
MGRPKLRNQHGSARWGPGQGSISTMSSTDWIIKDNSNNATLVVSDRYKQSLSIVPQFRCFFIDLGCLAQGTLLRKTIKMTLTRIKICWWGPYQYFLSVISTSEWDQF